MSSVRTNDSSISICAGLMNSDSSPGSLKSVCAANSVTSRVRASPCFASAAAAYLVGWSLWHVLTTTANTSTKKATR